MLLTDEQWALLQPLLPPTAPRRGRPAADTRLILEAILWKLSENAPWDYLPPDFPSHKTCYRYYRQWQHTGLLTRILRCLFQDLHDRGGFDFVQAHRDGLLQIHKIGSLWLISNHPSLDDTWQITIARICLWRAVRLARNPHYLALKHPTGFE
jgi:transposase